MLCQRKIVLCEGALALIENYEISLANMGFSEVLVEQAAAIIIETLYRKLARGALQNNPRYIGPDIKRQRFSLYLFDEDFISGKYRSDGDEVHVLSLKLKELHLIAAILGTVDAYVKVA